MPLFSILIAHNRTHPFPAPDAARSLFLHTATEPTQDCAVEHGKFVLSSILSAQFKKIALQQSENVQQVHFLTRKEESRLIKQSFIWQKIWPESDTKSEREIRTSPFMNRMTWH